MNKWVEFNKKQFGSRIVALENIIKTQVRASGKSDEFTSDMLMAIKSGRKITYKMQNAIDDNQNIATLRLNSHNQFFTTTLQVGVFGLFILIGIFFKSWWAFFRGKQLISLLISFCFFCNFLVESFLERQAGIVLFCVLLISLSQKNTSDKQVITVENKI